MALLLLLLLLLLLQLQQPVPALHEGPDTDKLPAIPRTTNARDGCCSSAVYTQTAASRSNRMNSKHEWPRRRDIYGGRPCRPLKTSEDPFQASHLEGLVLVLLLFLFYTHGAPHLDPSVAAATAPIADVKASI